MSRIKAYFPEDTIYTPPHHEQRGGGEWPSADDMVAEGRRLMLTSGVDYGPVMNPLIFLKCAAARSFSITFRTCPADSGRENGPVMNPFIFLKFPAARSRLPPARPPCTCAVCVQYSCPLDTYVRHRLWPTCTLYRLN